MEEQRHVPRNRVANWSENVRTPSASSRLAAQKVAEHLCLALQIEKHRSYTCRAQRLREDHGEFFRGHYVEMVGMSEAVCTQRVVDRLRPHAGHLVHEYRRLALPENFTVEGQAKSEMLIPRSTSIIDVRFDTMKRIGMPVSEIE